MSQLTQVLKIPARVLAVWQREGLDIYSAPDVVRYMFQKSTKKPDAWMPFFDLLSGDDSIDTHDHYKKLKTKEELEKLRLHNAQVRGATFPRADGEMVMITIATMLKLALEERNSTWPSLLAGKDEAGVFEEISRENRNLLEDIADEASKLWQKIYEKGSHPSSDEDISVNVQAEEKAKRIGIRKGKRISKPRKSKDG